VIEALGEDQVVEGGHLVVEVGSAHDIIPLCRLRS
jgi:hypothetical protein